MRQQGSRGPLFGSMRVEAAVLLPTSREEAWRRVSRWEDQPAWMTDARSVRVLTREREGVGVRVAVRTRVLGMPFLTDVLEVTAWDPPRRVRVAHRGLVRGTGEWSLEPEGGATRFTWAEDLTLPIPLLGGLALSAYRPLLRRLMRRSLANLVGLLRGA